jgi:tetratricopeptide (TPR) repeat protein
VRQLISFVFAFSLLFHSALGNIPDSIENVLKFTVSDTSKVMVYNRLARSLLIYDQQNQIYHQALQYAQQGQILAKQINFAKGEAELLRTMGNACYFMNDNEQAIVYYEEALTICEKLQYHNGMALNYYNLSIIYSRQSRVYYALNYLQKALAIWRQVEDTRRMSMVYKDIVHIYSSVGEMYLADDYAMESLRLAKEKGNRQEEA